MNGNLIIGCATMAVCLAIQCVFVSILLRVLITIEKKWSIKTSLVNMSFLLITVMLTMLIGNLFQISLWAGLFCLFGEFNNYAEAFYHSAVNFTTLGYGDMVMSEKWRLLGALEAANGVLMFGLTTGLIFTVLNELAHRKWNQRIDQNAKSNSVC